MVDNISTKAGILGLVLIIAMTACNENGELKKESRNAKAEKTVGQTGGVTLLIKDAALIQVDSNPQYNTAEWDFKVDKAGRYEVWLSSLTCDTLHLQFNENVIITAADSRLDKRPVGDEIVTGDNSVKAPWYRADSHMGSIFFSKPGEYQVQVISARVERHAADLSDISVDKHTLINSLILKPMVN
ncbi:MAG: hypothetical protein U5L72_09170 [Bacteroidales bacterium]|nr:hypothetical protein [Bacteroidales bacterium]